MKLLKFLALAVTLLVFCNCKETSKQITSQDTLYSRQPTDSTIVGIWNRIGQIGPVSVHFKENGEVTTDLGNDNSIEVVSRYLIKGDTIEFLDKEGKSCPNMGVYKMYNRGYTLAFDVIDDMCGGRIKATSGFWVRPNYEEHISQLNAIIEETNDMTYILHRARINLALSRNKLAKKDFDSYIETDSLDAKVFINRAATRFPFGLKGIVYDCNKAIALDSTDKNAYFLRGIAYYGLDEQQKGCDDFQKSIDLGFEILKEAEYNKCKDYW